MARKRGTSGTASATSAPRTPSSSPAASATGTYLRAGAIACFSPIMDDIVRFADAGGPVLGICNGFQILCEAGLLPGALVRNRSLKFQSHEVRVRVERTDTFFTYEYAEGQLLRLPIAHGEGGNVLGLMPHPERAVEALLGSTDGVGMFEGMRLG